MTVSEKKGAPAPVAQLPEASVVCTLRASVERVMDSYFAQVDGHDVTNVYAMVIAEVEAPLLERVLRHANGNKTKASTVLGMSRGTFRNKLKQYNLSQLVIPE